MVLTSHPDRELMRRHRAGDQRARETLIERYLPLAAALARRYRRTSEPLDDLIQVASVGLVKAVDRWEPERGLEFSTYAVPTILGELRRYFRDFGWLVRPPRAVTELVLKIERTREPLHAAIGREPAADDFAGHLERTPEAVTEAMYAAGCRWAAAVDPEAPAPTAAEDREFEHAEARVAIGLLTAELDPSARTVLGLRFGEDLPQAKIAERVGCSQVQVSRIIRSSLERIKTGL